MAPRLNLILNKLLNKKSEVACPDCGAMMLYKKNKEAGTYFLGCGRYPACKHTMEIPEKTKRQLLGQAGLFLER